MIERRSLRARLLLGACLWIGIALFATGFALSRLFHDHVVWQYDAELEAALDQLTALAKPDGAEVRLETEPADPRFRRAYGGRYWQIARGWTASLRSRSLWDQVIPPPATPAPLGVLVQREADVPGLGRLRVAERGVAFAASPGQVLRLAVALPMTEIDGVAARFDRLLEMALAVLAVLLLVAAVVQVELGLRPLARLRREVAQVRGGSLQRLTGSHPAEVRPLVEEINALLEDGDTLVARARARAADLAHGLKTSLQLVTIEAARLGASVGEHVIASEVRRMRAHIDHQLARARAGGQRRGRTEVTEVGRCAEGVARAVGRLAADTGVVIESRIDPAHRFAGSPADLEEVLGNLVENAAKWARGRVELGSAARGRRLLVTVEDDGPGLPAGGGEEAFSRGRRLDQSVPGSGLGLAIVRDIMDLYGGEVRLEHSPLGGLRAVLELPAA